MAPTDLSELSLELLITTGLTGLTPQHIRAEQERAIPESSASYDGAGWALGDPHDFDREHLVDTRQLLAFLTATQPATVKELNLADPGPSQTRFLERVQREVASQGVVNVLRNGVKHLHASIDLYYGLPTPGNPTAAEGFRANRFSVTRQLRYSLDETRRALDLALFINGLPFATMELKNLITNQDVNDAMAQYKRDRTPKERLFQFGVCAVHFAVDDNEVWFTTRLAGDQTVFLPFNKGSNDGAGNPPNPTGIKTDYLWRDVLTRPSTADLIESFITRVEEKRQTGKRTSKLLFPRYHQLDVVRKLLADARLDGVGRRYLIQHSAGSGKSNSIAWLAHLLIELQQEGEATFDTVLIVTDRQALDSQLAATVKSLSRNKWTTKRAESSAELSELIRAGQRIILTTVQKFPYIADRIGHAHRDRSFAIIIDEAHSSQGGRAAAKLNATLAAELEIDQNEEGELSFEDQLLLAMRERQMLTNASYFAFTATPKQKTLELFGQPYVVDGETKFRPFHLYTMKQAIQEGFILDVLEHYTPFRSYYRLIKTVADDPEFETIRAQRKLRHYVEAHPATVRQKAEIIVDHFHSQVIEKRKIDGQARAMVVTDGVDRAIDYWQTISAVLRERRSPYQAIIAFSGEREVGGRQVTEAHLNGFSSSQIPERFTEDPYRLLIVADKYQTGFDEPLLHTMYVDKRLSSVKAVQTLSRLNRAHPAKRDTFILDFFNDADDIQRAFQPFFRATLLSGETDPNKLHDLKRELDDAGVYTWDQVEAFVRQYLANAEITTLHPLLDACRAVYESEQLDNEGRIEFKGAAKAFVRTYSFLAAILPYTNPEWEELSIFLRFLIPKLPAPDDPDLAKGILDAIDLASYRIEEQQTIKIALEDTEVVIEPATTGVGGLDLTPELDCLSHIIQSFNELFAGEDLNEAQRSHVIGAFDGPIMQALAADEVLANSLVHSSEQNTLATFQKLFQDAMIANVGAISHVYAKQQTDPGFRHQLEQLAFALYKQRMQHATSQ